MKNKMNRRRFLETCVAGGSLPLVTGAFSSGPLQASFHDSRRSRTPQRNVLLLISDDHGIDQLGCYGNEVIQTPHLDEMAESGVRFTNAFCTAASCSASRGSILSGLYPHQNGQFGHQHNWHHFSYHAWVDSMPALLRANGYRTGLIGKLHVAPDHQLPFDYLIPGKDIMGNRDVKTMADKAGEFFHQDRDRPFFLLVGYSDPHRSAQGMSEMRNVENFSGFGNDKDYPGLSPKTFDPSEVSVPEFLPDRPEVREELADQYASIARLDQGVGMVLERLRESGRFEDTLILYISDNGIPFPGAKTTIYDSGVHLPMIVCSPEISGGGRVNHAMISFVDLLPTILDWTESAPPRYALPGRSFMGVLGEENPEGWDEVFQSHTFHEITMYYPMRAVRTRKYKYIRNLFSELEFPFATDLYVSKTWQGILRRRSKKMGLRDVNTYLKRPPEELYDIEKDPAESVNLAGDPSCREVLHEMRARLTEMRERTDDPWLINQNYQGNQSLLK